MASATELAIIIKAQNLASDKLREVQQSSNVFTAAIIQHSKMIGMAMAGMGAAIVGAAALSVKNYAELGSEIHDLAYKTGFSTEALSEFKYAAEQSGASLTGLATASKILSGAIVDAQSGTDTYIEAFERIGVDYKALAAMKPEQQFIGVMEALAKTGDETIRAATAADLFGRSGTSLLPILDNGIEGLNQMRAEAYELGVVFSSETANKADELGDSFNRLQTSVMGIQVAIGEALMPVIMPFAEKLADIFKWISRWSDAHPLLSKVVYGTTVAVGALLIPLGTMLIFLPGLIAGYTTLSAVIIPVLIVKMGALAASIWAAVSAQIALLSILGPAGWAILAGAAVLATAAVYGLSKAVKLPSLQHGGIVPGPIGEPVPVIAHGGEQYLGVGNRVSGYGAVNIYVDYLTGDRESAERLGDVVERVLRRRQI